MITPTVKKVVSENEMQVIFTYPIQAATEQFVCPTFNDVIRTYVKELTKAVEQRMKRCLDGLTKNMANIFYTEPYFVGYKEEDGHIWKFGFMAYDLMGHIIDALHYGNWDKLKNAPACDQMIKALLEYDGEIKNHGTLKACDLHSALMEVLVCDPHTSI